MNPEPAIAEDGAKVGRRLRVTVNSRVETECRCENSRRARIDALRARGVAVLDPTDEGFGRWLHVRASGGPLAKIDGVASEPHGCRR